MTNVESIRNDELLIRLFDFSECRVCETHLTQDVVVCVAHTLRNSDY